MSDKHLHGLLLESQSRVRTPSDRRIELDALLPEYARHLNQKGVMVCKRFNEYAQAHPDSYRHSTCGLLLRQYVLRTKAVNHVEHYAGDQMYVDFAGNRLEVTDESAVR